MDSVDNILKEKLETIKSQKYTILRDIKSPTQTNEDVIKILEKLKKILERQSIQTDYFIEGIVVRISCVNHNFTRVRK